ncbi:Hsp20 family protein [Sulfitobacter sp. R18_1]|uniref:Hsp20 family protein n=1 Tax=Sulfitobacter sp. R18_1 TaxID=2821104 RepID=UPI001ADBE739|nr:Hsp20 family protein [Sulfitobacter sp. R18_1]MBO9428713.1 Hsp20 family protein [Sulfitobacter sp. R18_1]
MKHFDLTPIYRSAIGFDQMASAIDRMMRETNVPAYPPYDIEQLGEDSWKITLAVAGFATDEIDVEVRDQVLVVSGSQKEDDTKREYLHKGIATRNFERKFTLADHVKITEAKHENGLLSLSFERELPKEKKPRKIKIN